MYDLYKRIIDEPQWSEDQKLYAILRSKRYVELFGDKCLPDNECPKNDTESVQNLGHSEQPSVQGKPKFKVGDMVRVLGGLVHKDMEGKMAFVTRLPKGNCNQFVVRFENGLWTELSEKYLEPYTEPEHRNLSQSTSICDKSNDNQLTDNMEEKELNRKALYDALCELETASVKVRKALIQYEQD